MRQMCLSAWRIYIYIYIYIYIERERERVREMVSALEEVNVLIRLMSKCVHRWPSCMYVCMYICMHVYMCGIYVCMYVCMYVCTYICMWAFYTCTFRCLYICLHTHVGDQTFTAGEHLAPGFSQWRLALAAWTFMYVCTTWEYFESFRIFITVSLC